MLKDLVGGRKWVSATGCPQWGLNGPCVRSRPRVARAGERAVHPLSFTRAGALAYHAWGGEVECKCELIVRLVIAYVPKRYRVDPYHRFGMGPAILPKCEFTFSFFQNVNSHFPLSQNVNSHSGPFIKNPILISKM